MKIEIETEKSGGSVNRYFAKVVGTNMFRSEVTTQINAIITSEIKEVLEAKQEELQRLKDVEAKYKQILGIVTGDCMPRG